MESQNMYMILSTVHATNELIQKRHDDALTDFVGKLKEANILIKGDKEQPLAKGSAAYSLYAVLEIDGNKVDESKTLLTKLCENYHIPANTITCGIYPAATLNQLCHE